MLGKLLKYELKATARIYLPMILLVVILTPICRLMTGLEIFNGPLEAISGMTMVAYVLSLVAMGVAAYIIFIYRFYKNLLTPEGYLMFTLPVSSHSLLLSKAIVAIFWQFISAIVLVGSIVGLVFTPEIGKELLGHWNNFHYKISMIGFNLDGIIALFIVTIVVSAIYNIFYFYCAMSIGQSLSKNKVLGSIAAAVILYIIMQVISTIVMLPLSFNWEVSNNDNGTMISGLLVNALSISSLVTLAFAVVFYFISAHFLSKKLNLE